MISEQTFKVLMKSNKTPQIGRIDPYMVKND